MGRLLFGAEKPRLNFTGSAAAGRDSGLQALAVLQKDVFVAELVTQGL